MLSISFYVYSIVQAIMRVLLSSQRSMNLFMQSGLQRDVLYVDGLKTGTIIK